MKVARSHRELDSLLEEARRAGRRIGLVPTMGALHDGHLSLIRAAKTQSDVVVVSIFVNPLQFNDANDLAAYPRDNDRDLELADQEGTDVVFMPSIDEMYPKGATTGVSVGPPLTDVLEGASRPGHFDGVATVVAKLFNAVRPNVTFFGQKDAQQGAVIRKLIADLSYPIELVLCPIVRESDGLAMSSRNVRLSASERDSALALNRALREGERVLLEGGDTEVAEKQMWTTLSSTHDVEPDYARAVDPETFFAPLGERVLLAVAARVGPVRLIDNLLVELPSEGSKGDQ
jgi:pantoate--beta-alanine ligase